MDNGHGLATKLPGLVVRCHLAMVKPVQEETLVKLAIQILTGCLEGKEQHTAYFVERGGGHDGAAGQVQHGYQEAGGGGVCCLLGVC